jgi:hypothetical protein
MSLLEYNESNCRHNECFLCFRQNLSLLCTFVHVLVKLVVGVEGDRRPDVRRPL